MPKLAVDAGHGLTTPGKRTPDGEHEWSFNNKVLLACVQFLKDYPEIEILRLDDPTGKRDIPLQDRTDKANRWGSDILISFHHNAYQGIWGNHSGTSTYIHTNAFTDSQKLAQLVQKRIVEAYGLKDRGIKRANFHMLREHHANSVLIEGAFMDSTIDIKKMRDNTVLRNAGIKVGKAVLEYYGIQEKKVAEKEELEMLEKAIVINSFADFPNAEILAIRLGAPIYLRSIAEKEQVAKEVFVVGGGKDKLKADKFTVLAGADRYETAAAVKSYLLK